MAKTKECGKCGATYSIDCFHKNKSSKDGRQSICKICREKRDSEPTTRACVKCGATYKVRKDSLHKNKSGTCRRCSGWKTWLPGLDNNNWAGGKTKTKHGYVLIRKNGGYTLEHVLKMEEHLGRKLVKGETVHHKNGIKDDNQIDNLELWSGGHPSGQRVDDLIDYILANYEDRVIEKIKNRVPRPDFSERPWSQLGR